MGHQHVFLELADHLGSGTHTIDKETGEKVAVAMRFKLRRSTFPYSNTVGPDVEWPEIAHIERHGAFDTMGPA